MTPLINQLAPLIQEKATDKLKKCKINIYTSVHSFLWKGASSPIEEDFRGSWVEFRSIRKEDQKTTWKTCRAAILYFFIGQWVIKGANLYLNHFLTKVQQFEGIPDIDPELEAILNIYCDSGEKYHENPNFQKIKPTLNTQLSALTEEIDEKALKQQCIDLFLHHFVPEIQSPIAQRHLHTLHKALWKLAIICGLYFYRDYLNADRIFNYAISLVPAPSKPQKHTNKKEFPPTSYRRRVQEWDLKRRISLKVHKVEPPAFSPSALEMQIKTYLLPPSTPHLTEERTTARLAQTIAYLPLHPAIKHVANAPAIQNFLKDQMKPAAAHINNTHSQEVVKIQWIVRDIISRCYGKHLQELGTLDQQAHHLFISKKEAAYELILLLNTRMIQLDNSLVTYLKNIKKQLLNMRSTDHRFSGMSKLNEFLEQLGSQLQKLIEDVQLYINHSSHLKLISQLLKTPSLSLDIRYASFNDWIPLLELFASNNPAIDRFIHKTKTLDPRMGHFPILVSEHEALLNLLPQVKDKLAKRREELEKLRTQTPSWTQTILGGITRQEKTPPIPSLRSLKKNDPIYQQLTKLKERLEQFQTSLAENCLSPENQRTLRTLQQSLPESTLKGYPALMQRMQSPDSTRPLTWLEQEQMTSLYETLSSTQTMQTTQISQAITNTLTNALTDLPKITYVSILEEKSFGRFQALLEHSTFNFLPSLTTGSLHRLLTLDVGTPRVQPPQVNKNSEAAMIQERTSSILKGTDVMIDLLLQHTPRDTFIHTIQLIALQKFAEAAAP